MKKVVVSSFLFLASLLLLLVMVFLFLPGWITGSLATRFPGALYSVELPDKVVALTIDDSPNPQTTQMILDELSKNDVRATFFLIAGNMSGNEKLVQRMVDKGHELGNHLVKDEISLALSEEEFERKFVEADEIIGQYDQVKWYRPGFGLYDREMLQVVESYGYRTALASVHPLDPQIPSAKFVAWYVLHNVEPGSIILLHDLDLRGVRTAEALAEIIPELTRQGYRFVTLSELVDLAEVAE